MFLRIWLSVKIKQNKGSFYDVSVIDCIGVLRVLEMCTHSAKENIQDLQLVPPAEPFSQENQCDAIYYCYNSVWCKLRQPQCLNRTNDRSSLGVHCTYIWRFSYYKKSSQRKTFKREKVLHTSILLFWFPNHVHSPCLPWQEKSEAPHPCSTVIYHNLKYAFFLLF